MEFKPAQRKRAKLRLAIAGPSGAGKSYSALVVASGIAPWSKVAVMEARKKRVFSQLGEKLVQPKNYGDKLVKYHELPIIHKLNINDQAIDANGVSLVKNKWYAYDNAGAMTGSTAGYATKELAKAAAGATGSIKSGNGNLYGGDTDIAVIKGSFPALSEEGGKVNAVGMKRLVLEDQVSEFGFATPAGNCRFEIERRWLGFCRRLAGCRRPARPEIFARRTSAGGRQQRQTAVFV